MTGVKNTSSKAVRLTRISDIRGIGLHVLGESPRITLECETFSGGIAAFEFDAADLKAAVLHAADEWKKRGIGGVAPDGDKVQR